jgi:hypothetical protein
MTDAAMTALAVASALWRSDVRALRTAGRAAAP